MNRRDVMRVLHVVGARPNFMKAAPILREMSRCPAEFEPLLVHTGQHYDGNMSQVFFEEFGLPQPVANLEVGSGSHARQTADIMVRLESALVESKPDLVFVYGDVNSTLAGALVCTKLLVPVAHVEAGLRSFDRTMPEEINRILTDQIADLLFTPSSDANENLCREGIAREKIHFVGNIMVDTLVDMLGKACAHEINGLPENYALVTLHRPSNVDEPEVLTQIVNALLEISRKLAVIFPVHPRTRQRIAAAGIRVPKSVPFRFLDPLSYSTFLGLLRSATVVITDSGGVQEETTFLGVPCVTLRENTERPITVSMGTNVVVGQDCGRLQGAVWEVLAGGWKKGQIPPLWDGHAAKRIVEVIRQR